MQGVDLDLIMHKLNHKSIAFTKHYLGITNDELQAVSQRLNLYSIFKTREVDHDGIQGQESQNLPIFFFGNLGP
jgi:stage III sporulation protein SpoIIIAA